MARKLSPISPGEILSHEFMKPLGISQNKLARDLDVPAGRINDIIKNKRAVTIDTALRLGIYFGTSPEFWLNLQSRFDLKIAQKTILPKIEKGVRPLERHVA
ncbi:MAG: HigA family addiction module antidote protein [Deltaproteobacteria bacterium]|nr:HigA family addiction module antidote protein [Deltaproteobacteria bacterium]